METMSYARLVPPGWQGFCCYCRRRLDADDWRLGKIMAVGDGNPWHCLCLSHLQQAQAQRRVALEAMARAVLGGL